MVTCEIKHWNIRLLSVATWSVAWKPRISSNTTQDSYLTSSSFKNKFCIHHWLSDTIDVCMDVHMGDRRGHLDEDKNRQGEGVKNYQTVADVFYGRPLTMSKNNLLVRTVVKYRVAPDIISGPGPGRNPVKFSYPAISSPGRIWPPDMRSDLTIFRCICLTV